MANYMKRKAFGTEVKPRKEQRKVYASQAYVNALSLALSTRITNLENFTSNIHRLMDRVGKLEKDLAGYIDAGAANIYNLEQRMRAIEINVQAKFPPKFNELPKHVIPDDVARRIYELEGALIGLAKKCRELRNEKV